MTPSEFEKMQNEFSKNNDSIMSREDFECFEDMMGNEEILNEKIVYATDGIGLTENGEIVLTNTLDIKYVQARNEQVKKNHKKNHMRKILTIVR